MEEEAKWKADKMMREGCNGQDDVGKARRTNRSGAGEDHVGRLEVREMDQVRLR